MIETEPLLAVLERSHDSVVGIIECVAKRQAVDPADAVVGSRREKSAGGLQHPADLAAERHFVSKTQRPERMAEIVLRLTVSVLRRGIEITDAVVIGGEDRLFEERIINAHSESAQGSCAETDGARPHGRLSELSPWKGLHGLASCLIALPLDA